VRLFLIGSALEVVVDELDVPDAVAVVIVVDVDVLLPPLSSDFFCCCCCCCCSCCCNVDGSSFNVCRCFFTLLSIAFDEDCDDVTGLDLDSFCLGKLSLSEK